MHERLFAPCACIPSTDSTNHHDFQPRCSSATECASAPKRQHEVDVMRFSHSTRPDSMLLQPKPITLLFIVMGSPMSSDPGSESGLVSGSGSSPALGLLSGSVSASAWGLPSGRGCPGGFGGVLLQGWPAHLGFGIDYKPGTRVAVFLAHIAIIPRPPQAR